MRNVFAGLMVVVGLFCGVTLAQNAQRDNPSAAPAQPGQASSSDQQIAACVYGACRNEIEIAKFAESKAKTDEVREFAQRMVRDHTPGCQAMQRLAGQLAADTPTQPRAGGNLDWNNIHKQIAQQCLASTKEELSARPGINFDKCFMGQQIGEHLKVVDALKVLRNYASPELRQTLDKELQLAQTHLQQAKQIEEQLQDRPSERVSRRPDSNK
jgi:putative membrane protein